MPESGSCDWSATWQLEQSTEYHIQSFLEHSYYLPGQSIQMLTTFQWRNSSWSIFGEKVLVPKPSHIIPLALLWKLCQYSTPFSHFYLLHVQQKESTTLWSWYPCSVFSHSKCSWAEFCVIFRDTFQLALHHLTTVSQELLAFVVLCCTPNFHLDYQRIAKPWWKKR